jgi:diguanylate cyclase (GGDEF)-like protein
MSELAPGTPEPPQIGFDNPAEALRHYESQTHEELIKGNLDKDALIRQLQEESRTDPLTGALNRRGFIEAYEQARSLSRRQSGSIKPNSLAMIDLDKFKSINDSYGHEAGDEALTQAVGIIRAGLRPYDIIGRLGGDEFVVLLHGATVEEAAEIFERIRYNSETFHELHKEKPGATALPALTTMSVGVSEIDDSKSFEEMTAAGDTGLYAAKESGRNQVTVS